MGREHFTVGIDAVSYTHLKHHSKNSYTTNVVNGNILVEDKRIRLPKLKWISMKKHREPAENCCLKSVTVSMEPVSYTHLDVYKRQVLLMQLEMKRGTLDMIIFSL